MDVKDKVDIRQVGEQGLLLLAHLGLKSKRLGFRVGPETWRGRLALLSASFAITPLKLMLALGSKTEACRPNGNTEGWGLSEGNGRLREMRQRKMGKMFKMFVRGMFV